MKCPTCGTVNGRTNRFCRGCGTRLDVLAPRDDQQPDAACPPDDIARGEELFEVWQLYSANDLDSALEKVESIIECTPDSASARSILALIYQRKAELRFEAGEEESGRDLLRLAIEQFERVVDLNPDSTADREKLGSLRLQLIGHEGGAPKSWTAIFGRAIRTVPPPALVAAGVFLVMLMVLIILLPGGGGRQPARAASRAGTPSTPGRISTVATSTGQSESSSPTALRVYTFPQPTEARRSTDYDSNDAPASPQSPRIKMPDEPVKLPPYAPANVRIVQVPKSDAKKAGADAAKLEKAKAKPEQARAELAANTNDTAPDGRSTLAQAIELHRQGRSDEAVLAAQQAIQLFQADIDAGRNATDARRGSENARKLITLWQQEGALSEEP